MESSSPSPPPEDDTVGKSEDVEAPATKKPGSKAQGRKRTKSGCLTCRRRRIKCGEERPICQNCLKSKRQCEGYNQRVVFKDPLNVYRGGGGPPVPVSAHVPFAESSPTIRQSSQAFHLAGPLPIAPRPHGAPGISTDTHGSLPMTTLSSAITAGTEGGAYIWPTTLSAHTQYPPPPVPDMVDHSRIPEPLNRSYTPAPIHYNFEAQTIIKQEPRSEERKSSVTWAIENPGPSTSYHQPLQEHGNWPTHPSIKYSAQTPVSAISQPPWETQPKAEPKVEYSPWREHQDHLNHQNSSDWYGEAPTVTSFTQRNLTREDDEDPFDISDEDMDNDFEERDEEISRTGQRNNEFSDVVALQAMARQDTHLRSFTSFIDRPDMLSAYQPSPQSSPLRDPMTARVFCHFINVTAPALSMFERHPANPLLIFQGFPVPKSQQHIWTYTFPTLALQDPGLLQAILALGSLHIAKLQNGPVTASLKHYAYGLRRVAKSVGLPTRRGRLATLAAAMLLAYYEVWSADHQKWSNHLLGARMLLKEIDFEGMTRAYKRQKRRQQQEEQERHNQLAQQHGFGRGYDYGNPNMPPTEDVDERFVAALMGKHLEYDMHGHVVDDNYPTDTREYSERDLETYEIQRDLLWWYWKQDSYQSMLGGGKLFMEYERWSCCLPRAPIGRLNATYGTFDHLILLNGRLVTFMSKDLKRKRLQWKANFSRSRPGPEASSQSSMPPPPPMPDFTGMVPNVHAPSLPRGFDTQAQSSGRATSPASDSSDEMDLESLLLEAQEEWQDIRNAYSMFSNALGDDFRALGPEFSAPINTPFGTALQYRTYGIAGIWLNFYMALIACHRAHPSMPPAAMVAVGFAAGQTAGFANEIGKIAAGIAPECSRSSEVSPGVGAALIESGTALFLAGVQLQDAAQRDWTIARLHDMARLTGWETALAVCVGCEVSWTKAAEVGMGPPYTRADKEVTISDIQFGRKSEAVLHALPANERRARVESSERVHFALGVMGIDEDFESLELRDR